jgi:hypothetical protein
VVVVGGRKPPPTWKVREEALEWVLVAKNKIEMIIYKKL